MASVTFTEDCELKDCRIDDAHRHTGDGTDRWAFELAPSACLEHRGDGADCRGPVGFHTTGNNDRAWPRCDKHQDERQQRYEDSPSERWANSDVAPPGYDGWGGENELGERFFEDE